MPKIKFLGLNVYFDTMKYLSNKINQRLGILYQKLKPQASTLTGYCQHNQTLPTRSGCSRWLSRTRVTSVNSCPKFIVNSILLNLFGVTSNQVSLISIFSLFLRLAKEDQIQATGTIAFSAIISKRRRICLKRLEKPVSPKPSNTYLVRLTGRCMSSCKLMVFVLY